jgi:FKBP-type peptidyl-prolyl cis-trans isomerase 2
MTQIKQGVTVKVHYTGKHLTGEVFDSTPAREPIIFTIGDEMMIPGFEDAVCTMKKGEKKTVTVKCEDAYGEYDPELMIQVKRQDVFDQKDPNIGDQVQIPVENNVLVLTVKEINGDMIVLDGNSDLVGKDLIFEIELLEILDGSENSYVDDSYSDELGESFGDDFDDEFGDEFGGDFDDLMYGPE